MKWTEVIKDTAWAVEDVLTSEECQWLINDAKEAGICERTVMGDERYRNSVSVALDDAELAHRVFERIVDDLPQEVFVDENCQNPGLLHSKEDLYGRWTIDAVNTKWRVARYNDGGHLGPHRDSSHVENENHRSLITLNGFLTDRPIGSGGATRFVKDDVDASPNAEGIFTAPDDAVLHRVESDKAGKAVLFFHDLMHEGEPVVKGSPTKWIFHSEIMYKRDPETAPNKTLEEVEARQLLEQAEIAETEGDIPGAIRLYSRAYRLDPTLETR